MKKINNDRAIILTCIAGILVSTYALYVEMAVEARPGYKALCDIAERASCSRVLTSKYAKGFGLLPEDSPLQAPNCVYGIFFYCLMIYLTTFDNKATVQLQFVLALTTVAAGFYLAYLLIFILYDLCLLCICQYIVSGILTMFVYKKMKLLNVKNK